MSRISGRRYVAMWNIDFKLYILATIALSILSANSYAGYSSAMKN